MSDAERSLKLGADFPYDASDEWWRQKKWPGPTPSVDWAQAAARGILADLTDRGGIKHGFDDVDEQTRVEIVMALAAIIRLARATKGPSQ